MQHRRRVRAPARSHHGAGRFENGVLARAPDAHPARLRSFTDSPVEACPIWR
jgi:hypothetical protein